MKNTQYSRQEFDFWVSMRTRWNDMDGLRHINHAAYLSNMETARLDFYHSIGQDLTRWDAELSTILAAMKIDYFDQISHPSDLDIGQRITRIGHKSFDIYTGIFEQGKNTPVSIATFTIVAYNYTLKQSISVPEIIKKQHRPFESLK